LQDVVLNISYSSSKVWTCVITTSQRTYIYTASIINLSQTANMYNNVR